MGGEGETESRKQRYDISMSRRTRRPQNLEQKSFEERENEEELMMGRENHKSLKQLIEGRCSLEQRFREEEEEAKEKVKEEDEEEKQQQSVVVRPADLDGDGRVRLNKRSMIKNYAQILSHMIKAKQESYVRSWRKSAVLSIKLIKHK